MKKHAAIKLFGTQAALSRAVGITRGAVHLWPETLDRHRSDRVIGAAIRSGLIPVCNNCRKKVAELLEESTDG